MPNDSAHDYEARADEILTTLEQGGWVWLYRRPMPKCRFYLSDALEDFYYGQLYHMVDRETWAGLEENLTLEAISALGKAVQARWEEFLADECLTVALKEPAENALRQS